MEIGNMFLLAAHLDSLSPGEFYMPDCNDCISGHANRLAGRPRAKGGDFNGASEWLGISWEEGRKLFVPVQYLPPADRFRLGSKIYSAEFTGPKAARLLRHYAITSKIDWTAAFAEEPELPKAPASEKKSMPVVSLDGLINQILAVFGPEEE